MARSPGLVVTVLAFLFIALVSPIALAGLTTEPPAAAGSPWTTITWQRLPAGDPLADVQAMTRWSDGYVAVGRQTADPSGERVGSSTPVWISADGATRTPLGPSTFGADAVVVNVSELPGGLVALTMTGGPDLCPDDPGSACLTLAGPVVAWTSSDGLGWTRAQDGVLDLADACDGCGVETPIVRAGVPGVLVLATSDAGQLGSISTDGSTWTPLPEPFPDSFEASDVQAFGPDFVAVGSRGTKHDRAAVATSSDGRAWTVSDVPTPGIERQDGSTIARLLAAPQGLLAIGSEELVPGRELWWSSPDGRSWAPRFKYPPLGVWSGAGEGSGLIPKGSVVSDGDQIIAYRDVGRVAAWALADDFAWKALTVTGAGARPSDHWPSLDLTMLPVGLLETAEDGSVWLGVPG